MEYDLDVDVAILANLADTVAELRDWLWQPIAAANWADVRGFWLKQVFDDRLVVCYFLPLLPILMLLRGRNLRFGIVLTGLAFLTYVFGAFYALFWLAMCAAFYRLSERFVIEAKRTDVIRWGPPLAAISIITGWYLITQTLQHLALPGGLSGWLFEHARWLFPLGTRALLWEPGFMPPQDGSHITEPVPLFAAIFSDAHLIGTAYFTIRMLHYFSELKRDTIPRERRTLLNFLAYLCYAPTLMQGPLERFKEFHDEMQTCHERRGWRSIAPAFTRIAWGLAKVLIATVYFLPILWYQLGIGDDDRYYKHPEQIESYALLYFGIFIQIFWLYLEFSGYCDIAAGMARLLGYRQIENFNRPWLATSMRDFWRRWHISLSFILRDYVYIPLGGNRRHPLFNVCFTFVLIGIWHIPIPQMAIWGVVMGLMVAVNQAWVGWMKRIDAAPNTRLFTLRRGVQRLRPLPQILSWALTMNAFVFSLLIFFGGSGSLRVGWELIRRPLFWLFSVEGG